MGRLSECASASCRSKCVLRLNERRHVRQLKGDAAEWTDMCAVRWLYLKI